MKPDHILNMMLQLNDAVDRTGGKLANAKKQMRKLES